ncbi:MAG: hypothetical protein J6V47_07085 [Bacteroidaceae bacterium]|nr:hypothetical protein [Bacteroidaceae bacterium]
MKKFLFLLVSAFILCTSNVFATNSKETNSTKTENPQVCKFSLSHYTGTINLSSRTAQVTVLLSCAQEEDVTATVDVYIDGELVASKLYTITAGNKKSGSAWIAVPSEYNGKRYTLKVE